MSGTFGWERKPVAVIRYRADSVSPSARATRQTLCVLVPPGALDDGVEPHVPAHVELVRDVVGVLLDLRAGGEQARPVRVRLEEIRVRGGRDVDGQAGVAVYVPGPAEVVLAVKDHEVVVTHPLELDGRAYPPETGPHDDRVECSEVMPQTVPQVPETLTIDSALERSRPRRIQRGDAGHRPIALLPCFGCRIQHVELHRVVGDRVGCIGGQLGLALVLVLLDRGLPRDSPLPASAAPRKPLQRAICRSRRCQRSTPGCCRVSP